MRTTLTVSLFLLLSLAQSCASGAQRTAESTLPDDAAIRGLLIHHYFRGMDEVSFETFEPAFHPAAQLAFVTDGELTVLDLAEWRSRLESLRADPNHPVVRERSKKSVRSIAVLGDTATATVRFMFPSRTYTDFLHLIRTNDGWQIIAKTFHVELQT